MNGERRQITLVGLVAAAVMAIVLLWVVFPVSAPKTDEARYEGWKHTSVMAGRAFWWERHLPPMVVRQFNLQALEEKYWNEHESLGDALVESGYLTNVAIAVTTVPTNFVMRAKVADQLRKAFEGRDEWTFWVHSNAVVVECRPEHVAMCIQALAAADRVSTNATTGVGSPPSSK